MSKFNYVLIVDDDDRIRTLLNQYLINNGLIVITAQDSEEAQLILNEFIVDLIILDVMMPKKSGFEFALEIRNKLAIPILMLTAMNELKDRICGLEGGADDYLAKPFEPYELLIRANKLINRFNKTLIKSNQLLTLGELKFDSRNSLLIKKEQTINLTFNESKLLLILINSLNQVISREELAKLSGGINERSIDVQIIRLRAKLEEDSSKPRYLQTIRGHGYILQQ